jgi:O-succinylbenzoic acid--CoA ligase
VRAVVVGGGPVSQALLDACPQAIASYGLTESCAMATLVRPGAPAAQRRTAGQALPGVELRTADDGVIELRGPIVMRGYLDDPQATAAALREGWLRTGDLGELDADGCLRVLSRRDDLIISGGENVYPAEVEEALREHPDVADAVVIGVPDAKWGEVPLALVQLRRPGASDLGDFLKPRLARYKLPRVEFIAEIPRLANGKPDRVILRNQITFGEKRQK